MEYSENQLLEALQKVQKETYASWALYEIAQRMELGINLFGPFEVTKEIIAEKRPFSKLSDDINKLHFKIL